MRTKSIASACAGTTAVIAATLLFSGCATTDSASNSNSSSGANMAMANSATPSRYMATDGRTIDIGHGMSAGGGMKFKEPHLEQCWLAAGFNFNGYDTLYIAPTTSTAKIHDDEIPVQELAKKNLVVALTSQLQAKGIFAKIVTNPADIPPGAHALKWENTIIEYSKGGGAARYFVGLYGGGQPSLKVHGVVTDNGKTVFDFVARRSGVSADARMGGAFMKDEDIQSGDIHSMTLDLTDFICAISGKYKPAN